VVTVVLGTDTANISRDYPVNVRVPAVESGLARDTVFLCFQVRALDPSRLVTPEAGNLPALRMAEVDAALRLALEL
jgi:mRNA interferase MazF